MKPGDMRLIIHSVTSNKAREACVRIEQELYNLQDENQRLREKVELIDILKQLLAE